MDEQERLLEQVAAGDYDALARLADLLDERGDPRALDARAVMKPDAEFIAEVLRTHPQIGETPSFGPNFLTDLLTSSLFIFPIDISIPLPSRRVPSPDEALRKVEEAISTKKLTSEIAQAMILARRIKCDRFLEKFGSPEVIPHS
jgi:hypothetical protein